MLTNTLFSTLKSNGGFTFHVNSGDEPHAGEHKFAVAYSKKTERTFPLDTFTPTDLVNYIADNEESLALADVYLGAWIDNGTVYLDCSVITDNERDALIIADENDQLAIFSFETMQSIPVPVWVKTAADFAMDEAAAA
jgi:hypothetical protein